MITRDRVTAVWAALVVATGTSWMLGDEHLIDHQDAAAVLVISIAFVKVRLVGMHFMELNRAPLPLRGAFHGWCLIAFSVVTAMYLAF